MQKSKNTFISVITVTVYIKIDILIFGSFNLVLM